MKEKNMFLRELNANYKTEIQKELKKNSITGFLLSFSYLENFLYEWLILDIKNHPKEIKNVIKRMNTSTKTISNLIKENINLEIYSKIISLNKYRNKIIHDFMSIKRNKKLHQEMKIKVQSIINLLDIIFEKYYSTTENRAKKILSK